MKGNQQKFKHMQHFLINHISICFSSAMDTKIIFASQTF